MKRSRKPATHQFHWLLLSALFLAPLLVFQNCAPANFSRAETIVCASSDCLHPDRKLTAADFSFSVKKNEVLIINPSDILAGNVAPSGQTLTFKSISAPSNGGHLTLDGDHYNFTSSTLGLSQMTYSIADSAGDTASGRITVQVIDGIKLTAVDFAFSTHKDETLAIKISDILAGNTAPPGRTLSFVGMGTPSNNGHLTRSGDQYNFVSSTLGISQFTYTISDSSGDSATGNIKVTVVDNGNFTGSFYACDNQGGLYVLDPDHGTLQQTLTTTYNGSAIPFNDLAIDASGALYGKKYSDSVGVYRVNASTGVSTYVSSLFNPSSGFIGAGMTFTQNGHIVTAKTEKGTFSTFAVVDLDITKSPPTATTLVAASAGYSMAIPGGMGGDIKALPDGYIYWTVTNNPLINCGGNQAIVRINPSTRAVSAVGCLDRNNVYGLGFAHKKLYGFSGIGDLISIDLANGFTTLINHTGKAFVGAAANPILW